MVDQLNGYKPNVLPFFQKGIVVKGFGRGSKQLGFPTANFSEEAIKNISPGLENGVYYGFASLDNDNKIYKMAANIGYCPFYKNCDKSIETYIIHNFEQDFYGSVLKIILIGYIRNELSFDNIEQLINEIKNDTMIAQQKLENYVITEDMMEFLHS